MPLERRTGRAASREKIFPTRLHTGTRRKYVSGGNMPLMRHMGRVPIGEEEFAQKCMEKSPAGAYNEKENAVMPASLL